MRKVTMMVLVGALLLALTAGVAVARTYTCSAANCPGTDNPDKITGTDRSQTFEVFAAADVVNAKGGADTIYGGRGGDDLNGGKGEDAIYDQAGDDADVVYAGSGDDFISVDDGDGRDKVYCGKGNDKVKADPGDFVASDCEKGDVLRVQNAQPNAAEEQAAPTS